MTINPQLCPACSNLRGNTLVDGFVTVYRCAKCEAIFGSCYLGESHRLVSPFWHDGPEAPDRSRYFDFQTLGSDGVGRRHGWFNLDSRRITQVG